MNIRPLVFLAALGLALALPSCGGGAAEPTKPGGMSLDAQPGDSPAMTEAKAKFLGLCATCHGTTGHGDGAAAAAFPTKPRSYADQAWQASVTDANLAKVILEGGPAVGKSPLMPPNADLKEKKDVVDALVQIIRSYRK